MAIMLPYLPPHLFGGEDFGNEYLHSLNFAVEFDFGSEFSGVYYNADYFTGDVEYHSMSVDCLRDDVDAAPATLSSRKKRRPSRQYRIRSVKCFCWYVNYLKPGETLELSHNIDSTDCFGEFRPWFWMSLDQAEQKLKKKLIARGYLPLPRSLRWHAEYPERTLGDDRSLCFGNRSGISHGIPTYSHFCQRD
jgi:hypothetical protein